MRKLIKKLSAANITAYWKGFAYIISSKIIIAAVGFLMTPIISRLYSPEEYGLFGLANSTMILLASISGLTLPSCILLTKHNDTYRKAKSITGLAILLNSFFLLASLICISASDLLSTFIFPFTIFTSILISIGATLTVVAQILSNINIRDKQFKKNVMVNITDNLSIRVSSLVFGLNNLTNVGLLLSEVIGKLFNIYKQLGGPRLVQFAKKIRTLFNFSDIKQILITDKSFPLYNLPAVLIETFYNQFILWIFSIHFSNSLVGYFTMSMGFLNIPMSLLANSIHPLIMSRLLENKHSLTKKQFVKILLIVSPIAVIVYGTLYFIAPLFIELYLGKIWLPTIEVIELMTIPLALKLIGGSIHGAYLVYNKQHSYLILKLFFLLLTLGCVYLIPGVLKDFHGVLLVYSIFISLEELSKILYLIFKLDYVNSK